METSVKTMTTDKLSYTIFKTNAGWVGISGSAAGLRHITLPQRSAEEARDLLGDGLRHAARSASLFQDLMVRLKGYFTGGKVTFPDRLDLSGATTFQRQVWAATRRIPYGETRSYGCVARQIKRPGAARAVGQALGKNPFLIIVPCHRVLTSSGGLGGFGGGLDMKKYLLSLEGSLGRKHPSKDLTG